MNPPVLVLKAGNVSGEHALQLLQALINGQAAVIEIPPATSPIAAASTCSLIGEWLQIAIEFDAANKPITPDRIAVERSRRRRTS